MPRLNQTSQKLRFKKGTAAQITAAENAYGEEAEALYVTDRKQLWVHNGTEYEEVNKYTTYFYNSSGTQSGNRFNSWADLQDSIGGREAKIQFEQDETIPAGAYSFNYQTWVGNGQNPDTGGLVITFPTGVTVSSALNWTCFNGLNLYSTSTSPIATLTVPHTIAFDRTSVYTDTAEFFKCTADGLFAIQISNGFGLYNDGTYGNYEVFNVDSSAYGTVFVVTKIGIAPTFQDNTVRSTVPIVYGWLTQTSEAGAGDPTHANIDGASIDFAPSPGNLFSNASVIGFRNGQPTDIVAGNVTDALSEIRELLEFGTYTPTLTGVANVSASTPYQCQYQRVGDVVTVSGEISVTATSNNTQTTIGISLPIASNFGNSYECAGVAHTQVNTTAGHGAAIYADTTNDRAEMDYYETHGAADLFSFQFTYKVI